MASYHLDKVEVAGDEDEGVVHGVPAELGHDLFGEILEASLHTGGDTAHVYPAVSWWRHGGMIQAVAGTK